MNIFKKNKMRTVVENDFLVYSPVATGRALKLSALRDGIFSLKGLGDGVSIDTDEDSVEILSPVDGVIRFVYPHGNCIGITANHGSKIMIHIGTEHSHLTKKYSKPHVKEGDVVKRGQSLATINLKYMKDNTTMTSIEHIIVVVPSGEEVINKHKGILTKETELFAIRKEPK